MSSPRKRGPIRRVPSRAHGVWVPALRSLRSLRPGRQQRNFGFVLSLWVRLALRLSFGFVLSLWVRFARCFRFGFVLSVWVRFADTPRLVRIESLDRPPAPRQRAPLITPERGQARDAGAVAQRSGK